MKKMCLILTMVSMIFLIVSCGNSNTPEAVATKFAKAYAKYDIEEAKKYATPESAAILDAINTMVKPEIKEAAKDSKVELISVENLTDTTATVKFCIYNFVDVDFLNESKSYNVVEKNDDFSVPMVKVDKKWLANISKDQQK